MSYPIAIPREVYERGGTRKSQAVSDINRMASIVESHLNDEVAKQKTPFQLYLFDDISKETGVPELVVRDLCRSVAPGLVGMRLPRPVYTEVIALQNRRRCSARP
jgi:hypothetical protein